MAVRSSPAPARTVAATVSAAFSAARGHDAPRVLRFAGASPSSPTGPRSTRRRAAAPASCSASSRCIPAGTHARRSRRASGPTSWTRAPGRACGRRSTSSAARSARRASASSPTATRSRSMRRGSTRGRSRRCSPRAGPRRRSRPSRRRAARRPRGGLGAGRARRVPRASGGAAGRARRRGRGGRRPRRGRAAEPRAGRARPLSEERGRPLVRRLAAAGDRAAALAAHERLRDRLRTGLGIAPSARDAGARRGDPGGRRRRTRGIAGPSPRLPASCAAPAARSSAVTLRSPGSRPPWSARVRASGASS